MPRMLAQDGLCIEGRSTPLTSADSAACVIHQTPSEADAKCLLLCLAALLGDDVAKLWEMASGKSNSLDKMSKAPASDEQASTSWHRAGDTPRHAAAKRVLANMLLPYMPLQPACTLQAINLELQCDASSILCLQSDVSAMELLAMMRVQLCAVMQA